MACLLQILSSSPRILETGSQHLNTQRSRGLLRHVRCRNHPLSLQFWTHMAENSQHVRLKPRRMIMAFLMNLNGAGCRSTTDPVRSIPCPSIPSGQSIHSIPFQSIPFHVWSVPCVLVLVIRTTSHAEEVSLSTSNSMIPSRNPFVACARFGSIPAKTLSSSAFSSP